MEHSGASSAERFHFVSRGEERREERKNNLLAILLVQSGCAWRRGKVVDIQGGVHAGVGWAVRGAFTVREDGALGCVIC